MLMSFALCHAREIIANRDTGPPCDQFLEFTMANSEPLPRIILKDNSMLSIIFQMMEVVWISFNVKLLKMLMGRVETRENQLANFNNQADKPRLRHPTLDSDAQLGIVGLQQAPSSAISLSLILTSRFRLLPWISLLQTNHP